MKTIPIYKIGLVLFFACVLAMAQAIAAPKDRPDQEPPLGTWTQQGTDLNGDGILNGDEDEEVFFAFEEDVGIVETVTFTLHVEGGCDLYETECATNFDATIIGCARTTRYRSGYKKRTKVNRRPSDYMLYGVSCDDSCTDECKFTITDVRP